MENENLDLDGKSAGNKDLWLFLIILDIIFLCVFGFFLYKHFAAGMFAPRPAAMETTAAPQAEVETVEEISSTITELTAPEPVAVAEVTVSTPAALPEEKEIPLISVLEEKPKPVVVPPPAVPVSGQKESISVETNPKSKYRKVTFRWFGEGEKVAIVSGFTMSKPQALKKKDGHWETTLSIAPGTYKFLYVIDGANRTDPYAPEKDGRSVVEIK